VVLSDYDSDNFLLRQAFDEVLYNELDADRMRAALKRVQGQKVILKDLEQITPLAFPIMVDRLRDRMSNERIEDRVKRMLKEMEGL